MADAMPILVVDDDGQVREVISRRLAAAGYVPVCAADGEEALVLVSGRPFDLVLLDIMMTGISGIEVLRAIRRRHPELAVVMVTSIDEPETAREALALGAHGYLVKPFSENELLIYVSHILHLRQLERENRVYRESLEQQVRARTEELEKALEGLKASQEQLLHQEKLATIGQLAAGVAHEIKNPAGYVGSNLGTLSRYLGRISEYVSMEDRLSREQLAEKTVALLEARKALKVDFLLEDAQSLIIDCLEGMERIKKIVEGLKSTARRESDLFRPVNINECLENALTITWSELKYKADVEKDFGELPLVDCYPTQIGQVFMNLLVNAAQALAERGKITVATRCAGDFAVISVTDTGCGIPRALREKIFEPFFTTKADGEGTGLGLSIVREIVAKHRGTITLESEEGRGSTLTVRIPVRQTAAR